MPCAGVTGEDPNAEDNEKMGTIDGDVGCDQSPVLIVPEGLGLCVSVGTWRGSPIADNVSEEGLGTYRGSPALPFTLETRGVVLLRRVKSPNSDDSSEL